MQAWKQLCRMLHQNVMHNDMMSARVNTASSWSKLEYSVAAFLKLLIINIAHGI